MTTHVSEQELADYVRGTLPSDDLLRIDDHLGACPECRARAGGSRHIGPAIGTLRESLLPDSGVLEHLSYEQLEGYLDGRLDGRARTTVEAHLEACAQCAEDLRDLRAVAGVGGASRPFLRWAGIAATAVAAGFAGWFVLTREAGVSAPADEAPRTAAVATPALDTADADAVAEAVRTGVLPIPDEVRRLRGRTGTLMAGSVRATGFRLLRPIGTAVETSRPTFAWTPADTAALYTVSVFTESLEKVAESSPQSATRWSPDRPLGAGETYLWQVRANVGGRELLAPEPPAPEARFSVLAEDEALAVAALKARHGHSPVALAVVLARAGLVDDARAALETIAADDEQSGVARRLLASLDAPGR